MYYVYVAYMEIFLKQGGGRRREKGGEEKYVRTSDSRGQFDS
jgi:hypothetical protein